MTPRASLLILSAIVIVVYGQLPMKLRLLPNTAQSGAVCLDGSPSGYYFSEGNGPQATEWILFLEGGGWCYSPADCYARSKTFLGSSKTWVSSGPDIANMNGFMTDNCTINPTFCNFSKVFVNYCDGTSFTSSNEGTVDYNGTKLYFRGRVILYNVIKDLQATNQLFAKANTVLLSGCSAGGLSTYHAADYVRTLLPSTVTKYAALPSSGYFLLANNAIGSPVYPAEMKQTFELGNCSFGVSAECLSEFAAADQWQCIFAQNALKYIRTPIFVSNSMFDSWQLGCIFTSEPVSSNPFQNGNCSAIPGWATCLRNLSTCTADQFSSINSYGAEFIRILNSTSVFHNNGNGGFIDSCMWHCELVVGNTGSRWYSFKINGMTMQAAVDQWWNSLDLPQAQREAVNNWHWDCDSYSTKAPYICNSLCTLP